MPQLAKSFCLHFTFSMISYILDATASSQLLFIVYDGRKGTIICQDAAVKAMIHHYCTKTVITTSSVGATTFGIMTLSINSLSIKTLFIMPLASFILALSLSLGIHSDGQSVSQTERQTDGQAYRWTDRQMDRLTVGQTECHYVLAQ
jgi:hypothetical protein